jgi:hypothetical protein
VDVDIFTLCDAATVSEGKLNILGAFDTIFVQEFPAVHPQCAIALRVRFRPSEKGDHTLAIHLIDEDGQPVVPPIEIGLNAQIESGHRFATIALALNLQRIKFKKEGEYAVNLAINRDEKASFQLILKKVTV